jgi:glycosyltransferase involved in cell wall biosynthesis
MPTSARRRRIVHVHKISGISGSERHLLALLPRLAADRWDVSLVALGDDRHAPVRRAHREIAARLSGSGVVVEAIRLRADVDPLCLSRLVSLARRAHPDIVHTHLVHADVYGAVAARLSGARLVSTRHNDDRFRRRWSSRALHRVLTHAADRLITISDALTRFVVETEGAVPEKVRRIHYGLDIPAGASIAPARTRERVLGIVGRLDVQKGHRYLLQALPRIRQKCEDIRLMVIGDGPLREALREEARRLGVADIVEFTGYRDDAAALMGRFDILVVPSLWEGFGLVLLEAMAAARPVVASRVSAIPEIVVDGETGILVPPSDPESLAEAVIRLLDDADLAERLGRQGRARLTRVFSVDAMTAGTEAVYDELLTMAHRRS